jgi:hypothetical protein
MTSTMEVLSEVHLWLTRERRVSLAMEAHWSLLVYRYSLAVWRLLRGVRGGEGGGRERRGRGERGRGRG